MTTLPRAAFAAVSEKQWLATVINIAHTYGWMVAHFRPAMTGKGWRTPVQADGKGFFDLVLAHEQYGVLFVEAKREKGRLSPDQRAWRNVIYGAGGVALVWRPHQVDEVHEILSGTLAWSSRGDS